MNKENQHIDHLFKSALENAEITPPPMVWDNIEAALDKKKKRGAFWWWNTPTALVAGLVGIGLLGTVGYLSFKNQPIPTHTENQVNNTISENTAIKNTASTEENTEIEKATSSGNNTVHQEQQQTSTVNTTLIQNNNTISSAANNSVKTKRASTLSYTSSVVQQLAQNRKRTHAMSIAAPNSIQKTSFLSGTKTTNPIALASIEDKLSLALYNVKHIENTPISEESISPKIEEEEGLKPIAPSKKEAAQRGFYVGAEQNVSYTRITYPKNYTNPLIGYKASMRNGMLINPNIVLGYDFSKHWGVETGVGFESIVQNYVDKSYENAVNGDIYLNSVSVPLLAQYKNTSYYGKKNKPFTVRVGLGLKYNYMTNYVLKINARPFDIGVDNFGTKQLGFISKIGLDWFLTKHIALNAGMSGYYGTHVSHFPNFNPSNTDRPTMYNVGGNVGLKYYFPKKK